MQLPRFPIRRELDGDFTLAGLATVAGTPADPAPAFPPLDIAAAAYEHQVWRLELPVDDGRLLDRTRPAPATQTIGEPGESDLALLHAVEVCGLWRPPVSRRLRSLDPSRARVWLAIADRWTLLSSACGDLRFLNAACKLFGAVWACSPTAAGDGWPSVARLFAGTAHRISDATQHLTDRLNKFPPPASTAAPAPAWPTPATTPAAAPSIVVLAGAGSGGAQQFLADLPTPSPVAAVCWYEAPTDAIPQESAYVSAWYPPEAPAAAPPRRSGAAISGLSQHTAYRWDDVATVLDCHRADLVVLIGMPIVPATVLRKARLGVVNAHNGVLPQYRGMDAVGWAVLNNHPVKCTLHLAATAVDQGDVLATQTVPYGPATTLRGRVKQAQLHLLRAVTLHVAATGQLPPGTPQGPGRQYYRLHPHLKRVLDTCSATLFERN
ncbi:formyltransferase family protein [Paractinoplanes rishiriensis]|uniref:phosphoribosylglycinamide formyltransferase 1 n=1 Tax=Paractinoplanes rishiriensis TaxID=1050105 RepID=A0A919K578_9ACTN|nr:formyltransferase family protein [Actinoplanes rishiriensis]GIF01132.1 hypothetical protein Ari01nite_85960 [Actinoplanes rishiriensis]